MEVWLFARLQVQDLIVGNILYLWPIKQSSIFRYQVQLMLWATRAQSISHALDHMSVCDMNHLQAAHILVIKSFVHQNISGVHSLVVAYFLLEAWGRWEAQLQNGLRFLAGT